MSPEKLKGEGLARLISLMERLRSEEGCPWDRAQTLRSLTPFIIEEAYEVVSAIDSGETADIKDELGDLLFQVIFSCRLLEEEGKGNIYEVMEHSVEKMIRRHPHVFSDKSAETPGEVLEQWAEIKKDEKKGKPAAEGLLHDVPHAMPSLMRAEKITKKAAKAGFTWPDIKGVMDKVNEELGELEEAILSKDSKAMEEELGDLLFTVVNAARFLEVSPEEALRKTVVKFTERFHYVEKEAAKEGGITRCDMAELESLWEKAKAVEK
ncbi:MAG: nucleoside triphosphate pyrophosphohydrolase [Thermodesulfobacteriota bacterium]